MSDDLDKLFAAGEFLTTPAVARFVGLSESSTRALAADLGVGRAGPSYVWSRDNVAELLEQLEANDDDEDEGDAPDEDAEDDDRDEDE
jgi:hypothetical protein